MKVKAGGARSLAPAARGPRLTARAPGTQLAGCCAGPSVYARRQRHKMFGRPCWRGPNGEEAKDPRGSGVRARRRPPVWRRPLAARPYKNKKRE
jgi:hypothetical protein